MELSPTPAQITEYADTLRRRSAEARERRRERAERAWATAHEGARVLREQYGAGDVFVFGSLVEGEHFAEHSDIDLAATGLTPGTHLEALGRLLGLSAEFELDLVDLEHCPESLARAVADGGELL